MPTLRPVDTLFASWDPDSPTHVFRTTFPKARALRRAATRGFVYIVLVDSRRVTVRELVRRERPARSSNVVSVWYCPRSTWPQIRANVDTAAKEAAREWFAPSFPAAGTGHQLNADLARRFPRAVKRCPHYQPLYESGDTPESIGRKIESGLAVLENAERVFEHTGEALDRYRLGLKPPV